MVAALVMFGNGRPASGPSYSFERCRLLAYANLAMRQFQSGLRESEFVDILYNHGSTFCVSPKFCVFLFGMFGWLVKCVTHGDTSDRLST